MDYSLTVTEQTLVLVYFECVGMHGYLYKCGDKYSL
jgi:hypothetical protein